MAKRQQFRLRQDSENRKSLDIRELNKRNVRAVQNHRTDQNTRSNFNSKKIAPQNVNLELPDGQSFLPRNLARMDYLKVPEQNIEIKARIVPHHLRHKPRHVLNSTLQHSIGRIDEESEFR